MQDNTSLPLSTRIACCLTCTLTDKRDCPHCAFKAGLAYRQDTLKPAQMLPIQDSSVFSTIQKIQEEV